MRTLLSSLFLSMLLGCSSSSPRGADASPDNTAPKDSGSADSRTEAKGPTCNACGPTVLQGLSHPSLCNGTSATLFEKLQNCACAGGPCGTQCDKEVCSSIAASSPCVTCMESKCASTWDPCKADT